MHEPQPIPRRENQTKSFDDDLIARTLRSAADIRRALRFSKDNLFLDADGRRSDPKQAAQASTDGCIRLAAMSLFPDDSLDARDLRWHAATRFQRSTRLRHRDLRQQPQHTPPKRLLPTLRKPRQRSGTQRPVTPPRRWKRPAILRPRNGSTTSSRNSPTTQMKCRYHRHP